MSSVGIRVGKTASHELAGGLTAIKYRVGDKDHIDAADLGKEYRMGTAVYRIEAGCGDTGPWIVGDPPAQVPPHSCATCAA